MRVHLDENTGAVYIDRETGPFDIVDEAGDCDVAFTLPGDAVELHTPDDAAAAVLDRVRAVLAPVKMSATARRAVERALDDLEPAGP